MVYQTQSPAQKKAHGNLAQKQATRSPQSKHSNMPLSSNDLHAPAAVAIAIQTLASSISNNLAS